MTDVSIESLLTQLDSDERVVRSMAASQLARLSRTEPAISAIPRLFERSFDADAPTASACDVAIRETRAAAVPFLLKQTQSPDPQRRARAVELLGRLGSWGGYYLLAKQILEPRPDSPPDWGDHAHEVLQAVKNSAADPVLSVRHCAACLLEELGQCDELTIPILIESLSSGTTYQKNIAALHLGRIGPAAKAACTALERLAVCPMKQGDYAGERAQHAAQMTLKSICV